MGRLDYVRFLFVICCFGVATQEQFVMKDVRLFSSSDILFGGVVEVLTPTNGWEKVCYDGINVQIADIICHKRGFDEGAMSVRQATSLGVSVNPLPSLECLISAIDGVDVVQCQYATVCNDHALLVCNYPGYLGCYSHTRRAPSLDEAVFSYSNMTIQFCLTLCRQAGYPYAGVAFGQECYCEGQILTGLSSRKLGNQDCYLPCVGDPHQICGGGKAAGIYDSRLGSCNAVYTDAEGALASPGFPGHYSPNEQCSWLVEVPNAANITIQIKSFELNLGDYLRIETCPMDQFIAFTGGSGGIRFESSGFRLDVHLSFTFTGGTITVTFNSSVTSTGAQGTVVTYAAGVSNTPDLVNIKTQMPIVTSSQITSQPTMSQTLIPSTETMTSPVGNPTTSSPPITTALNDDQKETISTATILVTKAQTTSSVPVISTPRFITMATDDKGTTSVAVIVAIAVGIILIFLLILTAVVLFTTSFKRKHVQHRSNDPNSTAFASAAYATYDEDGQTDSGIYDPGYQTVDAEDPMYLSIRNDPRTTLYDSSSRNGGHYNTAFASRNASVKTTKTDHDYQSVNGLSRTNTEKSYISIYPESNRQSVSGEISTETCKIAEDGYMIPTPKNSTQAQQTRL